MAGSFLLKIRRSQTSSSGNAKEDRSVPNVVPFVKSKSCVSSSPPSTLITHAVYHAQSSDILFIFYRLAAPAESTSHTCSYKSVRHSSQFEVMMSHSPAGKLEGPAH